MNISSNLYKDNINRLSTIFIIILIATILTFIFIGKKNINLIKKKIDNTSTITLLNNSVWNYYSFLETIDTKNSQKKSKILLKEHKRLYESSMRFIQTLLIDFKNFEISSNNKEQAIIEALYDIQTKISQLSYKVDQHLYSNSPSAVVTKIEFIKQEKDLLHDELILLSKLNQKNIKLYLNKLLLFTGFSLSSVCLFGYVLFFNFRNKLVRDLNTIKTPKTTHLNEIEYLNQRTAQSESEINSKIKILDKSKLILNEKDKQIKQLTDQLIYTQENERQNVSQFIHNDLGQYLTALNLEVSHLEQGKVLPNQIEVIQNLVQASLKKVKDISKYIHPPQLNNQKLAEVLELHTKEILPESIQANFEFKLIDSVLSTNQKLTLFRAYQEGLTNIMRHSNATKITVSLKNSEDCASLNVSDNGKGLTGQTNSTGLMAIKHRLALLNGDFKLYNKEEGTGTIFSVTIPVSNND